MRIIVIDGQGGNIGKHLVKNIRAEFPDVSIRAIGTNSTATANMLKGGANEAATGENALIVACRDADLIIGPIGIAVADSLLGEVSARMAAAVGQSSAKKILIPLNKCDILIPGLRDKSTSEVLADALNMIRAIMEGKL